MNIRHPFLFSCEDNEVEIHLKNKHISSTMSRLRNNWELILQVFADIYRKYRSFLTLHYLFFSNKNKSR